MVHIFFYFIIYFVDGYIFKYTYICFFLWKKFLITEFSQEIFEKTKLKPAAEFFVAKQQAIFVYHIYKVLKPSQPMHVAIPDSL